MRRWIAERLIDHLYWWERAWYGLYLFASRLRHGTEAPTIVCWGCAKSYKIRKWAEDKTFKTRHPELYA